MQIRTRKITLEVSEPGTLHELSKNLCKMGNIIVREHIHNLDLLSDYIEKGLTKKQAQDKIKEEKGYSIQNLGYDKTKNFNHIPSNVRTSFNSIIYQTLNKNMVDINNGDISIPSFTKNSITIPFQFDKEKPFAIENDEYYFFFPKTKIKCLLKFGKDKSNNKVIVDRIINKEYNICDSGINVKNGEFYLLLTYKQPETEVELTEDKVMGVDLGINRPVSIYIKNQKRQPFQIEVGKKMSYERHKFRIKRKEAQKLTKFNHGGSGRNRKTKIKTTTGESEKNWTKNMNHFISSELVSLAVKNRVKTIHLENLSGITSKAKNAYLKSWPYYQLQQFIEYKAKQYNINVVKVKPAYTSITCPTCLNQNKNNRNKEDYKQFKCVNPECDDYDKLKDADVVAAINIANDINKTTDKIKKKK